jgi:16S rRNA U516 pseudouridylate synthase RsuA-like enzyme
VTVNGKVVVTLGTKVDPENDVVHLNGKPVGPIKPSST